MSIYHRALKKLNEEVIPVPGSQPIPDSPALRKEKGRSPKGGLSGGPEGTPEAGSEELTFRFTPEDVRELRVLLQDNPDNRLSDKLRDFVLSFRG
jgi:hypothetical protein